MMISFPTLYVVWLDPTSIVTVCNQIYLAERKALSNLVKKASFCVLFPSSLHVGVQISATYLSIKSGELLEGVSSQDVTFDFRLVSVENYRRRERLQPVAVRCVGSQNIDGSGTQTYPYSVQLTSAQGSVGVTPGASSTIQDLGTSLDLSGNLNCEDIPYFCVTLERGTNPNPDFTLTGVADDSVLTACQRVSCQGTY